MICRDHYSELYKACAQIVFHGMLLKKFGGIMECRCGSGLPYERCCGRFIEGTSSPGHAVDLMRSRYCAYALGMGAYLVRTTVKENRYEVDAALIEQFAETSEWLKLKIMDEKEEAEQAMVEFKAYYREQDAIKLHHERSSFVKEMGEWVYEKGILYKTLIGRNEPCPCGSGKKYKRCCG